MVGAVRAPVIRRSQIMQTVTTIGLDIATVFQVHGVDADGNVVLRTQSAPILPSSGSWRRSGEAVSRHCSKWSPMQMTLGSPKSRARALPLLAPNCSG